MQSLYSPDNMTVVIAGGVEVTQVKDLVSKYFGGMKRFETIKPLMVVEQQQQPQSLVKFKKTEQAHMAVGVRTYPTNDPRRYDLSVLATVLGGGMSSRLFHEVREKRGLAYYVRSHSEHYNDCGSLVSVAGVDPKRVDDALQVILEQYQLIAKGTAQITKDELVKAKEYLKGHLVLELEDSRAVAGFYASQELLEDKIESPEEVTENIENVKLEGLEAVAKTIFTPDKLNFAIIGQFEDKARFEKLLHL